METDTPTVSPRKVHRSIPLLFMVLPLGLAGCDTLLGPGDDGGGPPPQIRELPRSLSANELEVLGSSNRFGLELLQTILREAPDSTHFLSPLSASMALGMTLNGADGATFDAMRETLHFGNLSQEEINASYRGLMDLLGDLDPAVSFQLANAIWHRHDLTPHQEFVDQVERHFDAAVRGLDFRDPGAADVINGWVKGATAGRIEEMVSPPIGGTVVAFLLNAIHFQADWTEQFDPERTREAPFHHSDGTAGAVQMMEQEGEFQVHATSSYLAGELPYGGQAFVMTLVVPRGESTVATLLEELVDGGWEELLADLSEQRARILLPRFELEWGRQLNDALASMGMGIAFAPGADFTRMFQDSSPWIDEVKQKTFVRVDEEGTEAAAVTQVVMVDSAPMEIRADRPFLLAIRERLSGSILFLGAMMEAPPAP